MVLARWGYVMWVTDMEKNGKVFFWLLHADMNDVLEGI